MPKNTPVRTIDRRYSAAGAGGSVSITGGGGGGVAIDIADYLDTNYGLVESGDKARVNLAAVPGLEF